MKSVHVYRLAVTLPEGSTVPGWEPENWEEWCEAHDLWINEYDTGASVTPPFKWRMRRNFLSKSAADRHAEWLREFGATVTVEKSNPVTWPSPPGTKVTVLSPTRRDFG